MSSLKTALLLFVATLCVAQYASCYEVFFELNPKPLDNPADFKNCSDAKDIIKVLSFKLDHKDDTYLRGQKLVGNLTYYTSQEIDNITLKAYGKHGVVPTFGDTVNLCQAKFANVITCPVKPGRGSAVFQWQLTQFQPIGTYDIHLFFVNGKDSEILCFEFKFTVNF